MFTAKMKIYKIVIEKKKYRVFRSDTTAETVQNENPLYENIKDVERTIPRRRIVVEKNAK